VLDDIEQEQKMTSDFVPALIDDELNPQLLARSRYTVAGLQFCNRNGLGCVPDVENIGYMGAVVLMKPSDFLAVVPPLDGFVKTVNYLKTGDETVFGTPFLDINIDEDTGIAQIKGHEGRSRMTYFQGKTNDASIPVALFLRQNGGTLRARHIEPWMIDLIQGGVMSERTDFSRGHRVDGPLFEQAMYLDKSNSVFRVPSSGAAATPKI
jgi:hypothetical protein